MASSVPPFSRGPGGQGSRPGSRPTSPRTAREGGLPTSLDPQMLRHPTLAAADMDEGLEVIVVPPSGAVSSESTPLGQTSAAEATQADASWGVAPPDRSGPPKPALQVAIDPEIAMALEDTWVHLLTVKEDLGSTRQYINSLLLTSTQRRDGLSTIALGLASRGAALGQQPICLVDADFRRRGLTVSAGADNRPGLRELLDENATLEEVLWPIDEGKVVFVPAGRSKGGKPLADDWKIPVAVGLLEKHFAQVLYDVGTMDEGSEVLRWGRVVRHALMVTRPTPDCQELLQPYLADLRESGVNVVGVILNDI